MANRSSSPTLSPNTAAFRLSLPTVAIAGATATLATAGALQAVQTPAQYEGSIQLVGILPDTLQAASTPTAQQADLSPTLANANIAPPDLIQAVQSNVLHDSSMAATVSARLKAQGINITPANILAHIDARTTPEGWLALHYRHSDAQVVQAVLNQVGQWYAALDSSCEIQACKDVPFIESQIPILQQQQQSLKQEMAALHQKLTQMIPFTHQNNGSIPVEEVEDRLLTQQHQHIRHIAQIETTLAETLTELQSHQGTMNLSTVKVQTGLALLRRIIPQYEEQLTAWQAGDRQLLALTLAQENHAAPATGHLGDPQSLTVERSAESALTQQQQALQAQMQQAVTGITKGSIVDMPQPIRELILADVGRFAHVGNWLNTLHRLQLLDLRRQTLKQMQQTTIAQVQEWRQATAVQDQLQQELATTTTTLSKYQQKYVIAQQQVAREALGWQVVSSAEVVKEPRGIAWTISSLVQPPQSLMTLSLP